MSPTPASTRSAADPAFTAALLGACERIAPTWPLHRLIAVNPFWGLRDHDATEVAARLAALGRARMLAPDVLRAAADAEAIEDRHLEQAAAELRLAGDAARWRAAAEAESELPGHWHNVGDLLDSQRDLVQRMAWHEEIVDQISQFCAGIFQPDTQDGTSLAGGALYARWREATRNDPGIPILMGESGLSARFAGLPVDRDALFAEASAALGIEADLAGAYAQALLLDVNGWASWIAFLRWQQRLSGGDLDLMSDLLAIRMAWDLVLWRHLQATDPDAFHRVEFLWRRQQALLPTLLEEHRTSQQGDWVWQRATELAFQERLAGRLASPRAETAPAPALQAVFCIDVRSEVMRRHLEARDPAIRTIGFAGFFGLPVAFRAAGTEALRPQLPGLLAPALTVAADGDAASARAKLARRAVSGALADAPPAMFSLVESVGPLYALRLIDQALGPASRRGPVDGDEHAGALQLLRDGKALSAAEKADLVTGILHGMGLERDFAPVVMLIGHGSSTRNNPHAASLACGACGGQSGAVNVRLLAGVLNDPEVRSALSGLGIEIPEGTRFVPALHDTTSDEIRCLDGHELPSPMQAWLEEAGRATRRERAQALGLADRDDAALLRALRRKGADWSEVRPEWGLADNAAFIAAPRERTRSVDLGGRAFLHDYRWQDDQDGAVLELIMTAPMVVAHWINMQYNASVADNAKYGSGSKPLHNVVGGRIGVFEGHGGDLRIGLPMQSLHDGERWMHTPLRLSSYICAPREAIERVYDRHEVVRELVDNQWLFLFRLDDESGCVERLHRGEWSSVIDADGLSAGAPVREGSAG